MKKNTMMRVASVLLIAVLLTTSAISGTFAKYTTQDAASDAARVAKWGVELQAIGNLYGDSYIDSQVLNSDTGVRVQAANATSAEGDDVVAPGTVSNEGFSFSLNGAPEVDGKLSATITARNIFLKANQYGVIIPVAEGVVTAANYSEFSDLYYLDGTTYKASTQYSEGAGTFFTLEDAVTLTSDYYPVLYALTGSTNTTSNINSDSINAIAAAVAQKLNKGTAVSPTVSSLINTYTITDVAFDSNTDLATAFVLGNEAITWAWAFENGTDATEKAMYNGADTILGLLENVRNTSAVVKYDTTAGGYIAPVEYTDYCLETEFSIDITVEQVD